MSMLKEKVDYTFMESADYVRLYSKFEPVQFLLNIAENLAIYKYNSK